MIRPIPDLLSPQKPPEPQPKAPTVPVQQNVQDQASTTLIPKKISRHPQTTSLKSLVKEKEAETIVQQDNHEIAKLSTPFNAEDLIQCWDAYSETLGTKAHLKNTMINCKPILLDNFNFEARVHNPVQKEELIRSSLDLLKVLRAKLKNDMIQMHIRIDENIEKKTAYTSVEKFEFLHNINPLLYRLIEEFDLTMD